MIADLGMELGVAIIVILGGVFGFGSFLAYRIVTKGKPKKSRRNKKHDDNEFWRLVGPIWKDSEDSESGDDGLAGV